jgi:hypothetical protein
MAVRGKIKAIFLFANIAPPKRAMAAIGEKFGISRNSLNEAATIMNAERTRMRELFLIKFIMCIAVGCQTVCKINILGGFSIRFLRQFKNKGRLIECLGALIDK